MVLSNVYLYIELEAECIQLRTSPRTSYSLSPEDQSYKELVTLNTRLPDQSYRALVTLNSRCEVARSRSRSSSF